MKNSRQRKILELIEQYDIDTQELLIKKLKESGFDVTQTTVSRDINQLKLVKTAVANGTYKYVLPDIKQESNVTAVSSAMTGAVITVKTARNLIVVKTLSGMANAVAVYLDSLKIVDILGSVAGDDTILLVITDDEAASTVELKLKSIFHI